MSKKYPIAMGGWSYVKPKRHEIVAYNLTRYAIGYMIFIL